MYFIAMVVDEPGIDLAGAERTRAVREAVWMIRTAAELLAAERVPETDRRRFCQIVIEQIGRLEHLALDGINGTRA